jgi:uncharacterized protein YdeI (YjbR/CyaY-like superfamily)
MSKKEEQVYMKNRDEWRNWLSRNHDKMTKIWLVYFKKHTKKSSITYDEAVEEALCFGWIDSTVNRIDEERYRQIFTPRNDKSIWSELNKKRVAKLIKENRMTEFGMKKVEIAKENGMWDKEYPLNNASSIPKEFSSMLERDSKAKSIFKSLTPSQKKQYIYWISSAKKEETKIKRSKDAIGSLKKNRILGMK